MFISNCLLRPRLSIYFFFFNDTATTEIYTLSLHDALPICVIDQDPAHYFRGEREEVRTVAIAHTLRMQKLEKQLVNQPGGRSEEHTSELQSHSDLVCRLLLEKKKHINNMHSLRNIFSLDVS